MKRILAVFLTLAMALNIAPMAAFAAADSDAASIVAVEETDENASSRLDEETALTIASDPFLQATYTQTEQKQTQQAEVDTSNVSMKATNSFGQLLVNGMEEQAGTSSTYTSRVTKVQLNGHTASVEFVADQTADLVVAIYTDDTAEEMVASGTVEVSGDGGNGAAKVTITGEIPETYTVKAFLLDKKEHAPLSEVYTDSSHTQVMVELSTAKASDFPEDRVVNLDGQDDTNFVVVKQNVTLISYAENPAGENVFAGEEGTGLVYVIEHASAEVKGLQKGNILTYEYAPGEMLIVQVSDIAVSGDAVTIYGDDTLDITDVFDAVKIENEADNDQLKYDGSTADAGVTYLGEEDADFSFVNEEGGGWLDDTNDFSVSLDTTDGFKKDPIELTGKASKKFEFQAYSGSDSSTDGDSTAQASIKGTVNVGISITSGFYIAKERKYFSLAANVAATADATASGEIEVRKRLGSFGFSPVAGCYIGIDPTFVSKAEVQMVFTIKTSAKIGFTYDSANGGIKNESKAPYIALSAKATGSLYAGIDLSPNIKILGKVTVLALKVELGETGSFSETVWSKGNEDLAESIHGCSQCYTVDLSGSFEIGGSMTVLKKVLFDTTIFKKDDWNQGKAYSAPDYNDFGFGDCPHKKYRVTISVSTDGSEGMTVYATPAGKSKTELGKIGPALVLVAYLDPGSYTLTATKDDKTYGANITIEDVAQEIKLYLDGSGWIDQPTNPDPDKPDEPETPDYTLVNGRLTINKESVMLDYESAEDTPWYNSRNEIDRILTQYMVKKISSYAFADCNKVTEVYIGDEITEIGDYAFSGCSSLEKITFVGTMAKWKEIQIGAGNDVLNKVTIICSDGVINASEGENVLVSGKCGENLFWYVTENVELIIVGTGDMYDYGYMNAPWYTVKKASGYTTRIQSVQLSDGMTKIGNHAFMEAPIKEVDIPDSVKVIGTRAFLNCNKLEEVFIPNGVTEIGESSFSGCHNIKNVTGMENIAKIGSGAFEYCSGLTSIEIPDSVMEIEREAFASCTILMDATLPHNEAYTTIASKLFSECENLKTINIPDNVTEIEGNAFEGCSELASVSGMKNVKVIGTHSFWMCKKLVEIHLTDTIEKIGVGAFAGCAQISQVKLPQNTEYTKVNDETFWGCENLTDVDIPNNVTRIGESAFARCEKIKTLLLPLNMTTIGARAFSGCTMLETIEIPRGVTGIGGSAFSECSKLKEVVLPENISGLDTGTFRNSGLVKITLPKTIGNIAPTTFENCAELSDVVFTGTKNEWSKVVIYPYGNDMLQSATIHCTDGDIVPTTENSITGDTAATENGSYQATFSGVEAGKDYVIIVSRSGSDPLNADNLIYINQITADADGELTVPFITAADAEEMTYVVACAQDGAPVDPDQPGEDEPSSGDDGGGAAIILIGGVAAVAAVAGVVLMMPVKVEGTVKLADQPVANATVQVLKGDAVKAETVTDANGHFTVKVKRGGYTMRVQWTDASGQPVTRTVDFKAPNANLNVAA